MRDFMAAAQISQYELSVEKLSEKHKSVLENFKTDNVELKKFLVEDALKNQGLNISNTYLWFYTPNNEFVAYLTILADAIGIHGTGLGEYFSSQRHILQNSSGAQNRTYLRA
ncbi:hypothetical protein L6303_05910 [archaeon]|nr:hypothetical protein [Nanoarchaeota archaeon]MCG2724254.1 hypothetical protein [archaeon]